MRNTRFVIIAALDPETGGGGAYNYNMEQWKFTGTVLRVEPNGFGIIRFDAPIGPSANTHGVFSVTLGSAGPYNELRPGVYVRGLASPEPDERKFATIKKIALPP